jgi:hypothetical protein
MPIAFATVLLQLASLSAWNVAAPSFASNPITVAAAIPDTSIRITPIPVRAAKSESGSSPKLASDGRSSGGTTVVDSASGTSLGDSEALSTIRIPESESDKLVGVTLPEAVPSRRSWIALSVAQHTAAAFDAYSTRQAIARGAVEDDPLMRPFAHSSGLYAAIQACPVVLDLAARRMQRSENNLVRHTWWLPQAVSTSLFLFSGVHNLGVASR